jgi:galactitol-specific phosphotransferase system IIC component
MIKRVTKACYILAAVGIVLDLMDIITIIMLPDLVICKAGTNILSTLMKSIAFILIMGAETATFLDELTEAKCYNADGQQMVKDAQSMYLSYVICQLMSSGFSCILAPFSAYYGGKLSGVPYVK